MKNLLIYPDVLHLADVGHLKFGKIFSLAVFLMVLFAGGGQQAKSEVDLTKVWYQGNDIYKPSFVSFSDNDSLCFLIGYPGSGKSYFAKFNTYTGEKLFYVEKSIYKILKMSPDNKNVYGLRLEKSDSINGYSNFCIDLLDIDSFKVYRTVKINYLCEVVEGYGGYDFSVSHDQSIIVIGFGFKYPAGPNEGIYSGIEFADAISGKVISEYKPTNPYIKLIGFTNNDKYFYLNERRFLNAPTEYISVLTREGENFVNIWRHHYFLGHIIYGSEAFYNEEGIVYPVYTYSDPAGGDPVSNEIIIRKNSDDNVTSNTINRPLYIRYPLRVAKKTNTLLYNITDSTWENWYYAAKYFLYDLNTNQYIDSTSIQTYPHVAPLAITSDCKYMMTEVGMHRFDYKVSASNEEQGVETLYPNPTTNEVKVTFENLDTQNVKIELFDINGNLMQILSNQIEVQGQLTKSFNMNSLMNGTYFIKVESKVNNCTFKVIKL